MSSMGAAPGSSLRWPSTNRIVAHRGARFRSVMSRASFREYDAENPCYTGDAIGSTAHKRFHRQHNFDTTRLRGKKGEAWL